MLEVKNRGAKNIASLSWHEFTFQWIFYQIRMWLAKSGENLWDTNFQFRKVKMALWVGPIMVSVGLRGWKGLRNVGSSSWYWFSSCWRRKRIDRPSMTYYIWRWRRNSMPEKERSIQSIEETETFEMVVVPGGFRLMWKRQLGFVLCFERNKFDGKVCRGNGFYTPHIPISLIDLQLFPGLEDIWKQRKNSPYPSSKIKEASINDTLSDSELAVIDCCCIDIAIWHHKFKNDLRIRGKSDSITNFGIN